jgi:hypothetical protein
VLLHHLFTDREFDSDLLVGTTVRDVFDDHGLSTS